MHPLCIEGRSFFYFIKYQLVYNSLSQFKISFTTQLAICGDPQIIWNVQPSELLFTLIFQVRNWYRLLNNKLRTDLPWHRCDKGYSIGCHPTYAFIACFSCSPSSLKPSSISGVWHRIFPAGFIWTIYSLVSSFSLSIPLFFRKKMNVFLNDGRDIAISIVDKEYFTT